jgi:transposase
MPGVGHILGLTVMLEADDFSRFESPGNYASYCRCVKSERNSNKKKKGEGNRKNGNKYLAWAYVEAAHLIIRFCPEANAFYQQKKTRTNGAIATKALANKLARATFCMMRDQTMFDVKRSFDNQLGPGGEPSKGLAAKAIRFDWRPPGSNENKRTIYI